MSRKQKAGERVHRDRWLVSYADFITLLFAFFVVLYASARQDHKKQSQIAVSIEQAFQQLGLFPGSAMAPKAAGSVSDAKTPPVNMILGDDLSASPEVQRNLRDLQEKLSVLLAPQVKQHVVAMKLARDGLTISLREAGFYDSGSAVPHAAAQATLRKLATTLAATPYDLRIEGHTDNVPIHTAQFDSNWELSTARASEMAKIFIVQYGVAPGRLSAAGYAQYHPVASNATTAGRAENRRVDIIVLPRISVAPGKAQP